MRISVATDDLDPVARRPAIDEDRTIGRNARITPIAEPGGRAAEVGGHRRAAARAGRGRVASSLDLRGARVDEALEALDRYLDDAALAGLDRSSSSTASGRARCATRSASGRRAIRS